MPKSKKTWYVLNANDIFEEKHPPVHCPFCDETMVLSEIGMPYFKHDVEVWWCVFCQDNNSSEDTKNIRKVNRKMEP